MDPRTVAVNDEFWGVVVTASGIATAVATVLALLLSMWWRSVDRATPEWEFLNGSSTWPGGFSEDEHTVPSATFTFANVGQGTGFRVQLLGAGCTIRELGRVNAEGKFRGGSRVPRVMPIFASGESAYVLIVCEPDEWDRAAVAVTWRVPSLWRRTRIKRILAVPLREIAPRPQFVPSSVTTTPPPPRTEPKPPVLDPSERPIRPAPPANAVARFLWRRQLRKREG